MDRNIFFILFIVLFFPARGFALEENETHDSPKQFAEYLGYLFWSEIKSFESKDFSMEDIIAGIKKADSAIAVEMNPDQAHAFFMQLMNQKQEKESEKSLQNALKELQKISQKEGIVVKENGKLYFELLHVGQGSLLKKSGIFHLKGTHLNGDCFIDTYSLQEPVFQEISESIAGFSKGTQGMKEGEKRKLYIHPDLAYGKYDLSHPNQLVLLEVELIKVVD